MRHRACTLDGVLSDRLRTAADPPAALPHWLRRPAAGAAALAALTLIVLAVRYSGDDSASRLDRHLDSAASRVNGFPLKVVQQSVVLGSPALIGAIALIVAAVAVAYGHRRLAVLALAGPFLTGVATLLLKPVVDRTIEGEFAYPSGHTGGATALGLVVALLVVDVLRLGRVSGLMTIACGLLLLGGGVGLSVTVLQWHYPTDAVGGFCTAVTSVCATALALDGLADRRARSSRRREA